MPALLLIIGIIVFLIYGIAKLLVAGVKWAVKPITEEDNQQGIIQIQSITDEISEENAQVIPEDKEYRKQLAAEKTKEAQNVLIEIENILTYSLEVNNSIDWASLINENAHGEPIKPKPLMAPSMPIGGELPRFSVKNVVNGFLPFLKLNKKKDELFQQAYFKWKEESLNIEEKNKKLLEEYEKKLLRRGKERDKKILETKEQYFKKDPKAIINYCERVLSNSKYPDAFPQKFDIDYISESKTLLVDYFLPIKENIPTLKEVKYIASRDEFKESHISESGLNKLYDDLIYQITLRSIYELYKVDTIGAISSIVFNGCVKFIDKGTGKEATACILSLQASKDEFLEINLENVEPKECFKKLKGVGSSKLHGLVPIAPIMSINKKDKRFISPYGVVDSVDDSTNIAAMDWKDFENLIREIFEKEFTGAGGEVKITRASRDEGVDAIAFDPDPLRGGKIVIQAKRYTNTVGVAAVRDLYGTVVNEGATKGILVTTTDYGPDAYKFAQNKPLTLLNGSNLLHLLEKHGHRAKIDIKEAKKILGENRDHH